METNKPSRTQSPQFYLGHALKDSIAGRREPQQLDLVEQASIAQAQVTAPPSDQKSISSSTLDKCPRCGRDKHQTKIPGDCKGCSEERALVVRSALQVQEGGDHYKMYKIQPVEYSIANGLSFLAGNVVKYVTRYKDKGGAEDIKKAIHYLNLILEFEYNER